MGNTTQSTQPGETIEVSISHSKFANTKLVKLPNEVFIQSIIMCEQKQFEKLQKQLQPQSKQNTDHLLLPKSIKFESTRLCGSSGHMQLLYPYYPYLLSQEVYNRNGKHVKFDQTDLWYLLYCISAGKEELIKCGCSFGSQQTVDMGSIFLNDQGRVKIACRLSWPGATSVWQRALQKQPVYISKQCFSRIAKGEMQPQDQQSFKLMQSQSQFSIGLTLINSALLIDQTLTPSLIDYKEMTYNINQLNRRINEFVLLRGYSDILKAIILSLLTQISQDRLTHDQLWSLIKDHSQQIQNRKNFVINNATIKVHQAVERYRLLKKKLQVQTQQQQLVMIPGSVQVVGQQRNQLNLVQNFQTSTAIKHDVVSSSAIRTAQSDKIKLQQKLQQLSQVFKPSDLPIKKSTNQTKEQIQQLQNQIKNLQSNNVFNTQQQQQKQIITKTQQQKQK